jgi:hypothetical protein
MGEEPISAGPLKSLGFAQMAIAAGDEIAEDAVTDEMGPTCEICELHLSMHGHAF